MTIAQEYAAEHEAGMHADTVIGCPLCADQLFDLLENDGWNGDQA